MPNAKVKVVVVMMLVDMFGSRMSDVIHLSSRRAKEPRMLLASPKFARNA